MAGENNYDRKQPQYILKLYIAGMTTRSMNSIEQLREVCDQYLNDRFQLDIIDLYQNPEMAKNEQIVAAPTLIKKLPLPVRKLIGDLSDTQKVLVGLDLTMPEDEQRDNE